MYSVWGGDKPLPEQIIALYWRIYMSLGFKENWKHPELGGARIEITRKSESTLSWVERGLRSLVGTMPPYQIPVILFFPQEELVSINDV